MGLVDDIELITKEIFENAIAPKAKRLSAQEHEELTTLLIQKDAQLKETMNLAGEQGDIDKKMKSLQAEVQKQDNCIKQLQKQLKDAETLLVSPFFYWVLPKEFCTFEIPVNSDLPSQTKTGLDSKSQRKSRFLRGADQIRAPHLRLQRRFRPLELATR